MSLTQSQHLSCGQCRRRKTKCDRVRPECGACHEAGTACVYHDSKKRGPKKGQLQALRDRIALLEGQLARRPQSHDLPQGTQGTSPDISCGSLGTTDTDTSGTDMLLLDNMFNDLSQEGPMCAEPSAMQLETLFLPIPIPDYQIEQLFFDRVYPSAPIIHKHHYLLWASQKDPPPACNSLRLAMRASAAAFSAQYESIGELLYHEAIQYLESLDDCDDGLPWPTEQIRIERIQAWLLLGVYEWMHKEDRQTAYAVSRALRLVQRSRLGELDASSHSAQDDALSQLEEKRRTFWLAFCFDRLLHQKDDMSWALHEETIRLRLPVPDLWFQSSVQIQMGCLTELMSDLTTVNLSPFAQCVTVATLYGRCLTHRRLVHGTQPQFKRINDIRARHEWLSNAAEECIRCIDAPGTKELPSEDPMQIFSRSFAHLLPIHLAETIDSVPAQSMEEQEVKERALRRAHAAAAEIAQCSAHHQCPTNFKSSMFMPVTLISAVRYIQASQYQHAIETVDKSQLNLGILLDALHGLRSINVSARLFLDSIKTEEAGLV
ncbi:hypothetical protein EJ05DRAFT_468747 [Pseudovirgaria hyperparasitica]|uniref:Zn(2)-C6 fungal-type domain-containing protein n=1 Tax=Pseudovirgaria hyperparasitica TaxID=470096 RepID=A0A6A6VXI9_9PEZI|nr:uncharacterized protein EJ05DRAFT_468747 [Pseudovirgaria hyperparasitica]KAF2754943.1 hypothetical protein EJ05DRAFT_468747 [Pseudovirgaria hyperparasitica]